jgi:hypothetical protein
LLASRCRGRKATVIGAQVPWKSGADGDRHMEMNT